MNKNIITAFFLLAIPALADPPLNKIVDFAGSTAPAIETYQANTRTIKWNVRNANSAVNGTGYTPFCWYATDAGASSIVTAGCTWVSQTTGVFNALFASSSLNTNGDFIYGVGLSSNGVTTARQGTLSIRQDPYASGVGAVSYSIPMDVSLYTYSNGTNGLFVQGTNITFGSVGVRGQYTINAADSVGVAAYATVSKIASNATTALTNALSTVMSNQFYSFGQYPVFSTNTAYASNLSWVANAQVATNGYDFTSNPQINSTNVPTKVYVDNATNVSHTTLKAYTDSATNTVLTTSKAYTDSSTNTLRQYVDTATNDTHTTLKAYTDTATNTTHTTLKAYTDTATNTTHTTLKSYTDVATNTTHTTLKAYTDSAFSTGTVLNASIALALTNSYNVTNTIAGTGATIVRDGAALGATAAQPASYNVFTSSNRFEDGIVITNGTKVVELAKDGYGAIIRGAIDLYGAIYPHGYSISFPTNTIYDGRLLGVWTVDSNATAGIEIPNYQTATNLIETIVSSKAVTNNQPTISGVVMANIITNNGVATLTLTANGNIGMAGFALTNASTVQAATGTFNVATVLGTNVLTGTSMDIVTAVTNNHFLKSAVAGGVTNWETVPASYITNGLITTAATVFAASSLTTSGTNGIVQDGSNRWYVAGSTVVASTNADKLGNLDASLYVTNDGSASLYLTNSTTVTEAILTNAPTPLWQTYDIVSAASELTLRGSTNNNFFGTSGALLAEPDATSYAITNTFNGASNINVGTFWMTNAVDEVPQGNYVMRWYSERLSGNRTITGFVHPVTRLNGGAVVTQGTSAASAPITSLAQQRVTAYGSNTVVGTQVVFGVEYWLTATGGSQDTAVKTYLGSPYSAHVETRGLGTTQLGVRGATNISDSGSLGTYNEITRVLTIPTKKGALSCSYFTNDATESFSLFGPLPYSITVTNAIGTGLGGTYAVDWFTLPRTNPAYGTKVLFLTGGVYTVDTGITNLPLSFVVTNGYFIGTYCTNGASITNGNWSLQYTW